MRLGTILPLRAFFQITVIPFIRRRYHGHFRVFSSPLMTCFVAREKPTEYSNFAVCWYLVASPCHWSLIIMELAEMSLWGWGKCCTWNDSTTWGRVNLTSDSSPVSIFKINSSRRKEAIVESEAENAHCQPSVRRFGMTKHSPRFVNHGALLWIRIRRWDGFSRRKPPLSGLHELTVEIQVCYLDSVLWVE